MFVPPLHLALAVCTLSASPNVPMPQEVPLWALQRTALTLEILDVRERNHFFAREWERDIDLRTIRSRYHSLRDAPHIVDAERLPPRRELENAAALNRAYKRWLTERHRLKRVAWMLDAGQECEELYAIYDAAIWATADYMCVAERREALARLRYLVGPHIYYAGCLPSSLPAWRFTRTD